MLKYTTAIVLLISMLGQTFSKYIVVLGYQFNKDFIAKNLCENRDKPAMKCDGKCYLCKRLKKEDKKDRENPERKADNAFEIIFFQQGYGVSRPQRPLTSIVFPYFQESFSDCFTSACFHPPRC